jgi:hypothetical protein
MVITRSDELRHSPAARDTILASNHPLIAKYTTFYSIDVTNRGHNVLPKIPNLNEKILILIFITLFTCTSFYQLFSLLPTHNVTPSLLFFRLTRYTKNTNKFC